MNGALTYSAHCFCCQRTTSNREANFSHGSIANIYAREEAKLLKYDLMDNKITSETEVMKMADEIEKKRIILLGM